MSPHHPNHSEPEGHGIYFLGKVGQRTQMTRSHLPPPLPPPPPAFPEQRPQLPPPSHLDPPFTPTSPKIRPQFSDLAARPQLAYPQHTSQDSNVRWYPPPQAAPTAHEPPLFHPPLIAQRDSFSSRNPGTVYEAISPVGHWPPPSPGQNSLFKESAYTQSPYLLTSHPPLQSPSTSYQSSNTSSGGPMTAPVHYASHTQTAGLPIADTQRRPNDITSRYIFTIRQQPIAARACGFGERDRRVIDPPPIVQLSLRDFDPTSSTDIAEMHYQFNIVHCALLSVPPSSTSPGTFAPSASTDVTQVPDPNQSNRISRRLMGTLVASPFVCADPDIPPLKPSKQEDGGKTRKSSTTSSLSSIGDNSRISTFFIFPDLSCRQSGLYRLRFTLMNLPLPNMHRDGSSEGRTIECVDSDVFEVYSAKDFPGMRPSTRLTKELKRMGAAVSVKKGKGFGGGGKREGGESVESGSASGESEGAGKGKGKGRQKKKRG